MMVNFFNRLRRLNLLQTFIRICKPKYDLLENERTVAFGFIIKLSNTFPLIFALHNQAIVCKSLVLSNLFTIYPILVESQDPKSFAQIEMSGKRRKALCDLSSQHGWMVIMQRSNMDVNFNRTWNEYKYA